MYVQNALSFSVVFYLKFCFGIAEYRLKPDTRICPPNPVTASEHPQTAEMLAICRSPPPYCSNRTRNAWGDTREDFPTAAPPTLTGFFLSTVENPMLVDCSSIDVRGLGNLALVFSGMRMFYVWAPSTNQGARWRSSSAEKRFRLVGNFRGDSEVEKIITSKE